MKLLHATPGRNLRSIRKLGVRAGKSRGAVATVWLVAAGMTGAALSHAQKRHGVAAESVAVLEVDVPRSWLRKGKRKGLWHTGGRDIPPDRITAAVVMLRVSR